MNERYYPHILRALKRATDKSALYFIDVESPDDLLSKIKVDSDIQFGVIDISNFIGELVNRVIHNIKTHSLTDNHLNELLQRECQKFPVGMPVFIKNFDLLFPKVTDADTNSPNCDLYLEHDPQWRDISVLAGVFLI